MGIDEMDPCICPADARGSNPACSFHLADSPREVEFSGFIDTLVYPIKGATPADLIRALTRGAWVKLDAESGVVYTTDPTVFGCTPKPLSDEDDNDE
jgi:hypothetical protein